MTDRLFVNGPLDLAMNELSTRPRDSVDLVARGNDTQRLWCKGSGRDGTQVLYRMLY